MAGILRETAAFLVHLVRGLRIVWPIFSGIALLVSGCGLVVAKLEGWTAGDGIYFAFITAFTIGYGDLVPTTAIARTMAVALGFVGLLFTAILAAVAVQALRVTLGIGDAK